MMVEGPGVAPGRYTPALLPFIVSFVVVAVEGIGDITATEEASMLATTGTLHAQRIQGGILGDGAVLGHACAPSMV